MIQLNLTETISLVILQSVCSPQLTAWKSVPFCCGVKEVFVWNHPTGSRLFFQTAGAAFFTIS